ncbi:Bestrophin, RFP-TM, chloride channel-domain-containing protein [Scleroderma yunnanense]
MSIFGHRLLAITIFRSWRILFFYGVWATGVCLINNYVWSVALQSTLLTVLGTVLGFVISFGTTSSYDRHNEARKLWSRMFFATRTFARVVWFHVPENAVGVKMEPNDQNLLDKCKAETLVEKKTVINLLEAYAVAVKHYLRKEDNIYYEDLYPFVWFLPRYSLPSNIPSHDGRVLHDPPKDGGEAEKCLLGKEGGRCPEHQRNSIVPTEASNHTRNLFGRSEGTATSFLNSLRPAENPRDRSFMCQCRHVWYEILGNEPSTQLLPRHKVPVHNVPLEISFYLSSYIAALEERNARISPKIEAPTMSLLHTSLGNLVDALTEMERIATTRVVYSKHLWLLTIIYCLILPFQTLDSLGWLTIPATVLASFMFFGFLLAGAEIESKCGYDKNDLPLKEFVRNICKELHVLTSLPPPRPSDWAFHPDNNILFPSCSKNEEVAPNEWVSRGTDKIREALHGHVERCCDHI